MGTGHSVRLRGRADHLCLHRATLRVFKHQVCRLCPNSMYVYITATHCIREFSCGSMKEVIQRYINNQKGDEQLPVDCPSDIKVLDAWWCLYLLWDHMGTCASINFGQFESSCRNWSNGPCTSARVCHFKFTRGSISDSQYPFISSWLQKILSWNKFIAFPCVQNGGEKTFPRFLVIR